jgi:hypothetical protein
LELTFFAGPGLRGWSMMTQLAALLMNRYNTRSLRATRAKLMKNVLAYTFHYQDEVSRQAFLKS